MNRIAGIVSLDRSPVDHRIIDRMISVMCHPGDSKQSAWMEADMGLGCAWIGKTPSADNEISLHHLPNERCVIAFDGRIDNRQELLPILKTQLAAGSARTSDEEIALAAYEKWGLDCPKHLTGDFAFALWDRLNHTLICARDHFGVKPFYYSLFRRSFVFASTPSALLASGKVPMVINEDRIADLLMEFGGKGLEAVDKTSSFYKGVFRLPPAHMLIVQPQGMVLQRYWQITPAVPAASMTEGDYIEAFQELFAETIRCRLGDVSVPASMLSGGMDSSAIVGLGRRVLAEEGRILNAIAVTSNSVDKNREPSYISAVINQGNLQAHLISETGLYQRMDELVKVLEAETEPFDCLMNLNRAVYLHARDQGISALLDGIDGDTLLSGSGRLTQLWRQGAYRTIMGETLKADGLTAEYKMGRNMFFNSFLSVITPSAPDWLRNVRRPVRYRKALLSAIQDTLIDRDFALRSHLEERFATLDSHRPRPASYTQMEFHKIALEHTFLTVGLERYERVASAFGIEARHPFTDVRLAEFCLGLPWQLKTHHGWTKMILRRAVEPYLPSEVIWRKDKDSLMWEVNRLILKERSDYFYQITIDEQESLKPYINMPKLLKFWQDYQTCGDENNAESIWSGVALAMWLRQHRAITKA